MATRARAGDVVEVVWQDANIVVVGDSFPLEYALGECGLLRLWSVGYYVGQTREYLTIAMEKREGGAVRDLMTIPVGDVKEVKVLYHEDVPSAV